MTSGAPWSVKGIDPKAREVAKDLARRSGMTLGEWLNRMILEEEAPEEPQNPSGKRAAGGVAEAVARVEGAVKEARAENNRLAERLSRVEAQASGPRSAEALRALEAALNRVAGHLSEGESRTRESLRAMEARIDQLGTAGGSDRSALLEEIAGRVEARLSDAEARTSEALVNLGQAFADLDSRVGAAEVGSTPDVERRIETLSAALSQQVEDLRGEIAEAVRKAEQVTGEAVERVGREVLSVADDLNRQVEAAERRSADAIEQVGGEVARIAEAMEGRFARSESAHAEALERLGAEISRITDRLTERIGSSERRSAAAIDEVGEQVTLLSERVAQHQERAAEDLAERIRQSEERTERLLDEARSKVDQGLARSRERLALAEQVSADPRLVQELAPEPEKSLETADGEAGEPAPLALQAFAVPQPDVVPADHESEDDELAATGAAPVFEPADFEAADAFGPIEPRAEDAEVEIESEPEAVAAPGGLDGNATEAAPPRQLSTREVIEQARAAARAAAEAKGKGAKVEKLPKRDAKLFPGLSFRKRSSGSSLHTALLVAGGAAFLSVGAASYFVAEGDAGGETPKRVADALDVFEKDQAGEIATPEADTAPLPATPRAAIALAPQPLAAEPSAAAQVAGEDAALGDLYAQGVWAVQAGDASGVQALRKAANLGHSPAQFYMAKLYAEGGAGLKKDPVAARRWTERAAEGGNRAAMHNLAIAMAEGQGGPTNAVMAAQWFKRAAELGLVDSQFNLGVLYEQGRGVPLNPAEAYKWYLVAARSGDKDALANAARVRRSLSPEARSVAERTASAFQASDPNPSATAQAAPLGASPNEITQAQKALSVLRYYQGPTDGVSSPALKMAIAAYQREAGLTATGVLDPTTLSRLQVFTR